MTRANWKWETSSRQVAFSLYIGKVSQILSFQFQGKGQKFYHYFPGNSNLRQASPPRWIGQTCRLWRNQGCHQVHQLQIRIQHDVNRLFSEPSCLYFWLKFLFSYLRTLRINNYVPILCGHVCCITVEFEMYRGVRRSLLDVVLWESSSKQFIHGIRILETGQFWRVNNNSDWNFDYSSCLR